MLVFGHTAESTSFSWTSFEKIQRRVQEFFSRKEPQRERKPTGTFVYQSTFKLYDLRFVKSSSLVLFMIIYAAKQVKEVLYSGRKSLVKISGDSMCSICRKKIGTSVFAVYPNGNKLVHFVCFKDHKV